MSASTRSKISFSKGYAEPAARNVRIQSLEKMHQDFETNRDQIACVGELYDRRTWTDGEGVQYYPYMFAKGITHDDGKFGLPKKDDVDKLIESIHTFEPSKLPPLAGSREFEDPFGYHAFNLMGMDCTAIGGVLDDNMKERIRVDSPETLFEMAEVYAKSMLRTVTFDQYSSDENVEQVITILNAASTSDTRQKVLKSADPITPQTLFRGVDTDEHKGQYISQFLIHDFSYGNLDIEQRYRDGAAKLTDGTTPAARLLALQQGNVPPELVINESRVKKHVVDGSVLGAKVHADPLFQFYYHAAMIASGLGFGRDVSGYAGDNNRSSRFVNGGGPSMFSSLAHVAMGALRVAWNFKWGISMKIRPEALADRIERAVAAADGTNVPPGFATLKAAFGPSGGYNGLFAHQPSDFQGTKQLYLQYPEGSPMHPAWPAGHAVVAGACTTVLKAMFDCNHANGERRVWPMDQKKKVGGSAANTNLVGDADNPAITIVGEFNKLASNVSLGRDFAGVHYRCDGDCGLLLGEAYAITYLQDILREFPDAAEQSFVLDKFGKNREVVRIKTNTVEVIKSGH